ncbi:MAG: DNA polymerase/3'-5' exonuclease PolX [Deferribacteres bacterium]|nr:DNA polymerase/3'-5' exonuclease PolX [Deferribacteres bacterium]
MRNQEVARIFNEIADILEIKGENPFRIRAYRRAARNIDGLTRDVAAMHEKELLKIPGIGADLAEKIREYVTTGTLKFYEELKKEAPPGLAEILSVPGLGPRTAMLLFEKLKIKSIDDLQRYAEEGRLKGLPGIKERTEENILRGIAMIKRHSGRFPLGRVLPVAEEIMSELRKRSPVRELVAAGSLRRWKDTIKDIDILSTSRDPEKVMDVFVHLPLAREVLMKGPTKSSIVTGEGIQVDLRVVSEDSFGSALAYFTGSRAHNIRIRELAVKKGLKINEYGIFDVRTGKKLGGRRESDVFKILGLPFIPPEIREDAGEIEAALENALPRLVDTGDIKGDLHVHSNYSDGSHSIQELAGIAEKKGYEYIAVTDHSKGLGVARGMSIEQILQQNKEIKDFNRKSERIKLLSGVEVDIRSDGALDYPDEVLEKLDMVIASIHSGFRQSRRQLTGRLVSAMKNPCVTIIAHPTGRLIGERDAYDIDMEEVLKTAKETGTVLEINAHPLRLDLNDIHIKKAREMGICMAVNTDAHTDFQFDFMHYGVRMARRGWLEKKDVLNALDRNRLMKHIKNKRAKR